MQEDIFSRQLRPRGVMMILNYLLAYLWIVSGAHESQQSIFSHWSLTFPRFVNPWTGVGQVRMAAGKITSQKLWRSLCIALGAVFTEGNRGVIDRSREDRHSASMANGWNMQAEHDRAGSFFTRQRCSNRREGALMSHDAYCAEDWAGTIRRRCTGNTA